MASLRLPHLLLGRKEMHQQKILSLISQINRKVDIMTINVDRIVADVAAVKTADDSIIALVVALAASLKDLAAQLAAAIAAGDPVAQAAVQAKLDDAASQLETNTQTIKDAVVAYTPVA